MYSWYDGFTITLSCKYTIIISEIYSCKTVYFWLLVLILMLISLYLKVQTSCVYPISPREGNPQKIQTFGYSPMEMGYG